MCFFNVVNRPILNVFVMIGRIINVPPTNKKNKKGNMVEAKQTCM